MARRASYDPKYIQTAIGASMLGADDKQLAAMTGISPRTLAYWKNKYPDFLAALKNGKDHADAKVAMSLYRRATGYEHTVIKVFLHQGKVIEHPVVEKVPGDVTAQIYWLKNRQPKMWRDRPLHADGDGDEPIKELLRAIRDSPGPRVNGAVDPSDIPVPAPS
jgi:hypothetical protein